MNVILLTGRLTKDPEVRKSGNLAIANFSIAVPKARKKEGGADADFFRITAFAKQAESAAKHLGKGSQVTISGRIQNDNYEKNGKKVYRDSIIADRIERYGISTSAGKTPADCEPDSDSDECEVVRPLRNLSVVR